MKITSLEVGMIYTNCYIVSCQKTNDAAVIDPGFEAKKIIECIKQQELAVRYIILTHGHFDHIMAVEELKAATGAIVVIHSDDAQFLSNDSVVSSYGIGLEKCITPDWLVNDGDIIKVGNEIELTVMHTPGHTIGSMCLVSDGVIFSGDTLFYKECGRCDLPTGNYQQMLASLARLARLPGDYTIYPGHGIATTLNFERKNNTYMREGLGQK